MFTVQVDELEKNLQKSVNNGTQKQIQIDGLQQALDKLKRKVATLFIFFIPKNRMKMINIKSKISTKI